MESCAQSRAHAFFFLICILSAVRGPISATASAAGRPKNVQVAVRARWSGTPLLLEAGELLSSEWKDLYWDFIDLWLQDNGHSECQTAQCCIQKIVQIGRSLLSNPLGSIFELSLMLRSASPRLVTYRQLARDSLSSYVEVEDGVKLFNQKVLLSHQQRYHLAISENPRGPNGSCCWVDIGSKLLLTITDLNVWLNQFIGKFFASSEHIELFDFDHVFHGSNILSPPVVLYGALGTECFQKFHILLADAAKKGKIKYVVRPVFSVGCEATGSYCSNIGASDELKLGGYGVELALKNMEYKAMDDSTVKKGVTLEDPRMEDLSQDVRGFIFSKLLERKPELRDEIMSFRDYLLSSTISDTLEVWELKDLGHQTAQRIVHASDPLQAMQEINQNFPSVVSLLSRMKINESIKDEITANQRMVPPGKSLMAMNGALINIEDIDLYLLMDLVHEELSVADQFTKLMIPCSTIHKLLSAPPSSQSTTIRVDFRSSHVYYLNNLEEDSMYRRWRSNINELLMPVFPGQLRYIRKNLYHAIYVIDPGTVCGMKSIELILSMYENNIPVRFGVILYSSKQISTFKHGDLEQPTFSSENAHKEDISSLIIRLFIYVKENHGAQLAFKFLNNIGKLWGVTEDVNVDALETHHAEEAFVETLLSKANSLPQDILLKLEEDSRFRTEAEESSRFVHKLGLSMLQCSLLMNGLVYGTSEDALMEAMNEELTRLQEHVYYGQLNSNSDVLKKLLSESGYPRYNPQIISEGKDKKKFVSLTPSVIGPGSILYDINYLHSRGTVDDLKPVTHLLVVNSTSRKGISLLLEGLRYLKDGTKIGRLGVLFHVNFSTSSPALLLVKAFDLASSYSHKEKILDFLEQITAFYEREYLPSSKLDSGDNQTFIDKVFELVVANGLPDEKYREFLLQLPDVLDNNKMDRMSSFLYGQLRLEFGANAVVTNGRIIIPMDDTGFVSEDFVLLESMELEQRSKNIMDTIEEVKWSGVDPDLVTSKFISNLIMAVSSSLSVRERSSERARFEVLHASFSAIILKNEESSVHIDAVIDPLSSSGQKLAPLLQILWKRIKPNMRIVLNPMSSLVDLPLKNYYRYVVPRMDDFSHDSKLVTGPKAFFSSMPLSKTLTMNLDVPESWLVEPVIAVHDLDNILLENLGDERTLQAVFELDSLVLTGHCSEKDQEPPRGLQLILGPRSIPHLVDTIVMANLGYWQMKVSPGVWYLQLAPGRSSEIYELKKSVDEVASISSKRIIINDLRGKLVHLEVVKRKGKEHDELLGISATEDKQVEERNRSGWNTNLLNWASGFIGSSGKLKKSQRSKQEQKSGDRHGKTINIFSIASGHLYERFTKIMILSVLKHTQRPVKFWFIKNYLSPQFKDVIPHMAREYGFDYELVTYKWPTWLHKQKEKQRIIWAYKILFLDVIFPLSLEKVIFVDADQVVRADMGELYDMDIKGRPLAYTPFCDNNKEMDGYRFWRQGFWKDHLRGKAYHISALYVVDLVKFRQTAAGDNLRVFYETLSKDPNSLSNLDQDLPNYAQHTVPIFSLPQEWLWCESWCGNATKAKAKTIDLCNNPMTKEPKLQGARRIVSEWVDLDTEARQFTARILGESIEREDKDAETPPKSTRSVKVEGDEAQHTEL